MEDRQGFNSSCGVGQSSERGATGKDHTSGGKGDEDLQDDLEKIHGEEKDRRSNKDRV